MNSILQKLTLICLGLFFTTALLAQPANDDCSGAIAIGSVTDFAFTTVDATSGEPYHPNACVGGTADSLYNDVWYAFTADFTGKAEFTTCGTADFDTNIAAYAAGSSCPPTEADLLACSEDGVGCDGFTSIVTFDVVMGETYLLRIGGWGNSSPGEEGTGTFSVSETSAVPNDNCADAIAINSVIDYDFTTVGATTDGPYHPTDCTGGTADSLYNDIWYLFTADFTGTAEFTTCGTADFDTNLGVYGPGASCPPTAGDLIACNEDGAGCIGYTSKLTFDAVAGEQYLLRIGGWGNSSPGEEGSGTFTIRGLLSNDECADAVALSGTVTDQAFSTVGATTGEPAFNASCNSSSDSLYNDVWYRWTADFTGEAEFTTCGTANFDTNLGVYQPGSPCPPAEDDLIACSEDATGCSGYTSRAIFDAVEGETYLLRIGGWGNSSPGEEGSGTFTVQEYFPPVTPPNDDCDGAVVLDLGPEDSIFFSFSTQFATTSDPIHDTGTPIPGCLDANEPVPYNDVWYTWVATFTGWIEYSNCGLASFDSKIVAYGPDPTCPPDVESVIACGDDGCAGFTSLVQFPVVEGSSYLFRMGAWSQSGAGTGNIQIRRIPPPIPPPNDSCQYAEPAWVSDIALADDLDPIFEGFTNNGGSTSANPKPTCMQGNEFSDVWYHFNSGENEELEIRIFKYTSTSNFTIDLFNNCQDTTPVDLGGFCFNTANEPVDFVTFNTAQTLPGTPTEYYLRISSDLTYEEPGQFFFQLLGMPYTNTNEIVLDNFRFFPNPVSDQLSVQFDLEAQEKLKAQIINPLGQTVKVIDYGLLSAGPQSLQVSVSDLTDGVYFFRMQLEEGEKSVRFVKE